MSVAAAIETKADDLGISWYDEIREQELLAVIIALRYAAMLKAVHELVASAYPEVEAFRLDDVATREILAHAAERVVRIDATTRAAIIEQLQIGQARGYSTWQIAHGVPADGYSGIDGIYMETWRNRSTVIARTEIAEAQRVSAINRYRATGIIDRLYLRDGDDDGPCKERNGTTVPIGSDPQLLHPQCTLIVSPVLKGDTAP